MLHSLCYRQLHFDVHACEQFAKTGGELGAGGGGRRWLSGRYFTHSLTLKYVFGPDDAPAVGEAARRCARTGLKTPEGFDASKVLQAECRLFSTNDKVFGRLEILDVVVLDDLI